MRIPNRGDYAFFQQAGKDYRIRHLEKQVEDFQNGTRYQKMEEENEKLRRQLAREREQHRKELARQEKEFRKKIRLWQEAAEDSAAAEEKAKATARKYKAKYRQAKAERDRLAAELEQASITIRKLLHQLGRNHTNSHKPSSMDPIGAGKKNTQQNNSRRRSGKKPGAQQGHPHHPRKKLEPTTDPVIHDGRPAGTENEDGWYKTDRTVTKLKVVARIIVDVVPHVVSIWRNRHTGAEKRSLCPNRLKDEINYSPAPVRCT